MPRSQKAVAQMVLPTVQIDARWTVITPEMAKAFLAANTGNRNVRKTMVEKYARDMSAGRWRDTGEGIRTTSSGRIIDGQHRLHAIVRAGVPVAMFVFSNVPEDAQDAIDSGLKRTAADHLQMHLDEENAPVLAALVRVALDLERIGTASRNDGISTGEIVTFIQHNPDVRTAAQLARATSRHIDGTPACVGYCAWVIGRLDPDLRDEFFYRAATGEDLRRGDPRLVLKRRLADARRNRERLSRDAQISLIADDLTPEAAAHLIADIHALDEVTTTLDVTA